MEALKIIIIITLTMALSITLTMRTIDNDNSNDNEEAKPPYMATETAIPTAAMLTPSKTLSRFLAEEKNPRAAEHCRNDKKMCDKRHGKGWKCCNNKCMDLANDKHNCGGCKKKCKYTQECCRGQCVDVAYDKRHCGQCNHPCQRGKFCVYGMCEYA